MGHTLSARARSALDRLPPARVRPFDLQSIDWSAPIDKSKWFFSETLTPLYYTTVYTRLSPEHRLRYNQLTGMLSNELIGFLETHVLDRVLDALSSNRKAALPAELGTALDRFRRDEQRHAHIWRRLNRLSEPAWYSQTDHHLLKIPALAQALASPLVRHPAAFPFLFWIQLVQEERSVQISRCAVQVPVDRMEPRYAAVYRAHLQDEIRHVQIDRHLIEHFYLSRPAVLRRLNAAVFRYVVTTLFLVPKRSTVRVIEVLANEYPELKPVVPQMLGELRGLEGNDDYHRMMYSRETTPITFDLFDRCREFRKMRRVLRAYQPANRL